MSPIGVGGEYQETTTRALKQIDEDIRWSAIKFYEQGQAQLVTFKDFSRDLRKVTDALNTQISGSEKVGLINNQMLSTLNRSDEALQRLTNCVVNPLANGCEHLAGSDGDNGLGKPYWDSKLGEMFGRMDRDYYGGTTNIDRSTSNTAKYAAEMASQLGNNGVNGHLMDIKEALKSGGGSSGEGGQDIDYSKMPGSAQNPLHVAGSEYTSQLCKDGAHCFFDLETINKQFQERKDQLKNTHDGIKDDMVDMFQYSLSGSAAVPKCFDMFSMFGRSYSVCPEVEGYWEMIAAIMMFIFYFLALMIVAKR